MYQLYYLYPFWENKNVEKQDIYKDILVMIIKSMGVSMSQKIY